MSNFFDDDDDLRKGFGGDNDDPFPDDDPFADTSFGDGGDDPDFGPEPGERTGPNRTFIIIAAIMIVFFVIGLIAVVLLATQQRPPSELESTATAIVATNQAVEIALLETQTQVAVELVATQTAQAQPTNTPSPTPTNTPTTAPTVTPTPTIDPTDAEGTRVALLAVIPAPDQTATAIALNTGLTDAERQAALNAIGLPGPFDLTATAVVAAVDAGILTIPEANETLAALPYPTLEDGQGGGGVDANAVALTATALTELLAVPSGATPTLEVISNGTVATPAAPGSGFGAVPTALPQTGLFDDMVGSPSSFGMIALMTFGLMGVIFVSRRLRSNINK